MGLDLSETPGLTNVARTDFSETFEGYEGLWWTPRESFGCLRCDRMRVTGEWGVFGVHLTSEVGLYEEEEDGQGSSVTYHGRHTRGDTGRS